MGISSLHFPDRAGKKSQSPSYKIDTNYTVKPFLAELMNPTSIAFDREGQMYVSSRFDGTVYRVAPNGTMSSYAEGMGVATGIAFDRERKSCMSATAAEPFSRSRAIARFLSSPPWNRASLPITWRSGPQEICS